MTQSPPRRSRPRPTLWIAIGLVVLGGAALAAAVVAGSVSIPVAGPTASLPSTVTVTTASGTSVVLHRAQSRQYSWNLDGDYSTFTTDSIDATDHTSTRIPIASDWFKEDTAVGPAVFRHERMLFHLTDSRTGKVDRFGIRDPFEFYWTDKGSDLPEPTAGQLESRDHGWALGSVTSDDRAVAAIAPFGVSSSPPAGPRDSEGYRVYFDLAALHSEGRTSLGYPLDWYANPLIRATPLIGGLACAALWLAAIILFIRLGITAVKPAPKRVTPRTMVTMPTPRGDQ